MSRLRFQIKQNFDSHDIEDLDFESLYQYRRRDANFCTVFTDSKHTYALRDHLGVMPLYYRWIENQWQFALNPIELILPKDQLDPEGIKHFLGLYTLKLAPIVRDIKIVRPGQVLRFTKTKRPPKQIYQYQIKAPQSPRLVSMDYLVNRLEKLMLKALQRTTKEQQVGLLLSGGIDSGIIGIYLNKLGIKVDAYTSAPHSKRNYETQLAKQSAKIAQVQNHVIDQIDYGKIVPLFKQMTKLYRQPYGNQSAIGITSLIQNTNITQQKQIVIGQNCDNMTTAMSMQNWSLLLSVLPKPIKNLTKFKGKDWISDYFSIKSHRLIDDNQMFRELYSDTNFNRIQLSSLASQVVTNTQGASEGFTQPFLNKNILVTNPYWDMDLVEWYLTVPLYHRLTWKSSELTKLVVDKTVVKQLAKKYLPEEQTNRKKAFNVPKNQFDPVYKWLKIESANWAGIQPENGEKFRAAVLEHFVQNNLIPKPNN